ncbi:MAG TPA: DNA recombination protein RmuC [Bacteroidia bacterium]|nr:DNA recombination protein RmuC [Bacteroidia bacterium]
MEIIFLITGIVVGAVIGFLISKSQKPKGEIDINNFEKKISSLETENKFLSGEKERIKSDLEKQKSELASELSSEREKLSAAGARLAKAEEAFRNQDEKIKNQKTEVEELQKRLTTEFKNIANEILEEKSKKFTEQNKTNLDSILNPLKTKIEDFEKKVENTYKAESTERITLKAEIKQLVELNKQVSDDANNLSKALKGDNKTQGNWGEVILEKILERSGLSKERGEYKTQETLENSHGEIIRPDAIIYLPDSKHIIVDSKVSLVSYQNFVVADTEEQRAVFLKEHVQSLKNHIKGLSEKYYASSNSLNTPDFVLMFLPIESSFGVAVQSDQEIFSFAWDRKIVVVSPSTLLATLRTIAAIWKQEMQTKNALEIAKQSGALYDKFVAFVEDLDDIGKNIDRTHKAYSDARNKLEEGKGNLISRAEKIKDLGAKASKSLPENLLDKENNHLSVNE